MTWQPTSRYVAKEVSLWAEMRTAIDNLSVAPIPAPTPKRYVIVLEETGEVRCPRDREPYVDIDGLPWIAIDDWTHDKRTILRVVSREAK